MLIKGGISLFRLQKRYIIIILFILLSSFLGSKQIKINYTVEEGVLNLTEELMLSSPVKYSNYEMYVVFEKGEFTYSNYANSKSGMFKAVELFPVAVIRIKKDNPHAGHDSYSIKLINEEPDMEQFGEIMSIAEKICHDDTSLQTKSLNFEISEIIMILQIMDIL